MAAVRGAGELLQEDLPESARREFVGHVLGQTGRLQALAVEVMADGLGKLFPMLRG